MPNPKVKGETRDSHGQFASFASSFHQPPNSYQSQSQPNNQPSSSPFINIQTSSKAIPQLQDQTPPRGSVPPMVDLKITNPVTYLKAWWRRVMYNEGIDFRFRIHPLTAIAIALLISAGSFGIGHIAFPKDSIVTKLVPALAPVDPVRDTAFTGIVRFTKETGKYFLETKESEAITLSVPANVDLSKQIGKRIFASGKYNIQTHILSVVSASNLEILPIKITPVPVDEKLPLRLNEICGKPERRGKQIV